ncbi:MAG TPA: alkaline phosphatase family protein [Thermoleophilaceae bacterium]
MRKASIAILILIAAVSACGAGAAPRTTTAKAPAGVCGEPGKAPARYAHVVWIVMENHSYSDILGSGSSAPFTRSLAKACGSATGFHAETHPSLPNYIAMTSGSTHGISDDNPPSDHRLTGASIFSQLGSHWRALQESMPQNCLRSSSGLYAPKHNPAAYFTNVARACSRQDVRLGSSPSLSARFTFITPNLCHDMHNCGVSTGDRFLATLVPKILRSRQYKAGRTALFITWDEDDGSQSNQIATLVVAPHTPAGTSSSKRFTHYSLLRTTEEMLGLKKIGAARTAPSMRSAFGL